jgi:hypothetical protein
VSFKTFDLAHDVASIVSSINEVVSISSSIYANTANVKFFRNIASASAGDGNDLGGYWESVYDSSPTSSLSTAMLDLTYGYSTGSSYNASVTATSSQNEKIKIYRHFASALLGNADSVFSIGSVDREECFFIMVKRGIQKDELKKGNVEVILNGTTVQVTASDASAPTSFKQTVGGDYAPLKYNGTGSELGQVWYNAGVIVLAATSSVWSAQVAWSGTKTLENSQYSSSINQLVDGMRTHMEKVSFHNQTNLYSTVYFCRATNTEFNYSSNPTFVDENKRIRVTSGSNILQTRTYVTTVGLYDANDNLLAVAKVNKPITKSPDTEAILRIRLDY